MAYATRHPAHVEHLVIADSAAPKLSETVFLFNNVFPEGNERQEALAFANTLGDPKAEETNFREYLMMLFYSPTNRDAFLARLAPGSHPDKEVNDATWVDSRLGSKGNGVTPGSESTPTPGAVPPSRSRLEP